MIKYLISAPENYSQMLWKIAAGTGTVTFGSLWLLGKVDSVAHAFLFGADAERVDVLGISLPVVPALITVGVAILTRAFKLHDRVSDVLGIRKRFDLREIIRPLTVESGLAWTTDIRDRAAAQRDKIMRR